MTDSFDPVSSRDYVPELVTSYKQINEGMDNFWSQEIDNYNYAADFAGDGLKQLAEVSTTIGDVLAKREAKKKQEDFAKGHMWFYENGIPEESMRAYDEATSELYEEGRVINDMRFNWESNNGDIWNSVEFKKLNKAEQHGAVVAFVESKLQQYDPNNNEKMKNATSYEEYKAAESLYRLQLYRQLGDINPALVHKHLFEGQRKKEAAAYENWNATRTAAIKEEEISTAKKGLESCTLAGASGVNCIMNFTTNNTHLYDGSLRKARLAAIGHLKDLASNGVITEDQANALLDMTFTHKDGHETTYRDQYKIEANELEDAVNEYNTNEYNRTQNEHKVNAHNETQKFLENIPKDKISKKGYDIQIIKDVEALITEQKMRYNGHHDPYLTTMLESLREDKNIIKQRKLDAEEAFLNGELNSQTLKNYPIMVQLDEEIKKKAKAGDVVIDNEENYNTDLEAMVKKKAKLTADGYDDGANQLVRHFQAEWKQRTIELLQGLPDDQKHLAPKMAYEEIKLKFDNGFKLGPEDNPYQDQFGNYQAPGTSSDKEIKANAAGIDKSRVMVMEMIGHHGVESLNMPRMFFSEAELIKIQNDSASAGIIMIPEKAKFIAKQFDGLNAIDVINMQRASLGMEPLTSDALEEFNGLGTEAKHLLNYSSTSVSSARAWGTYGKEVISIRPDGFKLKSLSDELNLSFPELTAGVELGELLEYDGIDFGGDFELIPEKYKLDYNRLLYKYSGGENKTALDNLIYPEIKKSLITESGENDSVALTEKEIYLEKINHLDPKNRNVPVK